MRKKFHFRVAYSWSRTLRPSLVRSSPIASVTSTGSSWASLTYARSPSKPNWSLRMPLEFWIASPAKISDFHYASDLRCELTNCRLLVYTASSIRLKCHFGESSIRLKRFEHSRLEGNLAWWHVRVLYHKKCRQIQSTKIPIFVVRPTYCHSRVQMQTL